MWVCSVSVQTIKGPVSHWSGLLSLVTQKFFFVQISLPWRYIRKNMLGSFV